MSYVERWDKLKRDFEAKTQKPRPQKEVQLGILGTIKKASGITPVLKDLDDALKKGQRAPVAQAINKFMQVRGPYVEMLMKETGHAMDDLELATAYKNLQTGLGQISVDAGKDLEELQKKKVPGKVAIPFFEIEGDVRATIARAKKDLAAFAALEKKHQVLAKADAALKDTEKYTKSAARTDYKSAREALTSFKKNAKKCAEDLAKVIAAEKTNDKFTKPVQSFHDAMKAFSTVTRVDQQIVLLNNAEQAAAASA
jgi:hypothetical protein